jgi:hypothetical protein
MSYHTQAAIGPYPLNCLLHAIYAALVVALPLGFAGIVAMLPSTIFRLPRSVGFVICRLCRSVDFHFCCHRSGCIAPAVDSNCYSLVLRL